MILLHELIKCGFSGKPAAFDISPLLQHDLTNLWQQARAHRVQPLLAAGLLEYAGHLPPSTSTQCKNQLASTAFRNQYLLSQLQEIEQLLCKNGIPGINFKGPRFTEKYYRDISLRQSSDVDVLVHPNYRQKAALLLTQHEFSADTPAELNRDKLGWMVDAYEAVLRRSTPPLTLELHWGIGSDCYHALRIDDLWKRAKAEHIPTTNWFDFTPEEQLLYYAGHGLGHRWTQLNHVCIIHSMVQHTSASALNWNSMLTVAHSRHKHRSFLVALALANQLLDSQLPDVIHAEIQQRKNVQKLTRKIAHLLGPSDRMSTREALRP